MRRTLKVLLAACLLFVFLSNITLAISYPSQSTETRYVNDFAGIMSDEDVQKLNNELKDYNIRTSNEVVVVTVESLQGMTVDDYTLGLANFWGVGKSGKDNGVVLLVAPNEGEVRIEIGEGLENILTQSVTDNILDDKVMPYFENKQMSEGIFAGALSIMQNIDQRSARAEQIQNNGQSLSDDGQAQSPAIDGEILKGIGYFIVLIIAIISVFVLVSRSKEKSRSKKEILDRLKQCEDTKQQKLVDYFNEATVKLTLLKKDNPKSVWEDLESAFNTISFENIDQQISAIRMKYSDKESNHDGINGMLDVLEKEIDNHITTCKKIKATLSEVENAKEESAKLLRKLQKNMEKTESITAHPDVFPETKTLFDSAKAKLQVAQKNFEMNPNEINWLEVHSELKNLDSAFNEIQYKAESNKATCERARKEGPQLLKDLPQLMKETEEELASGDSQELLIRARNEYSRVSSAAGSSAHSPDMLDTYLKVLAIRSLLDGAREDHRKRIADKKREAERIERERRSRKYSSGSGGGSFRGSGSSHNFRSGSGGGSFRGSGSSRKF